MNYFWDVTVALNATRSDDEPFLNEPDGRTPNSVQCTVYSVQKHLDTVVVTCFGHVVA